MYHNIQSSSVLDFSLHPEKVGSTTLHYTTVFCVLPPSAGQTQGLTEWVQTMHWHTEQSVAWQNQSVTRYELPPGHGRSLVGFILDKGKTSIFVLVRRAGIQNDIYNTVCHLGNRRWASRGQKELEQNVYSVEAGEERKQTQIYAVLHVLLLTRRHCVWATRPSYAANGVSDEVNCSTTAPGNDFTN